MDLRQTIYYSAPVSVQNALVSMYGYYLRRKRYGTGARAVSELLATTDHWSASDARDYQTRRFLDLLATAVERVPYYRDTFARRGLSRQDFVSLDDLQKIPVLTKETVRLQGNRLVASGAKPYWTQYTSGSTGTPLVVHVNRDTYHLVHSLLTRHERRHGVEATDLRATFAGRMVQPATDMTPPFWRYNHAEHQVLFSAYHLSDETLPSYVNELARLQPAEIIGYPSAIYTVASHVLRAGGSRRVRPKVVISNSETLFAWQRDVIEQAFCCPVRDYYGSAEAVVFGAQCSAGTYHFDPVLGITEIVDGNEQPVGPNEPGRLVCTTLSNDVMPLLRYEIGDEAVRLGRPCACGSPFDGAVEILGRNDDAIVTSDGRSIGRMDHIFKGVVGLLECQVVQEDVNRIRLRLVSDESFDAEQEALVVANTKERLGSSVQVLVERLVEIPRTKAGKFKGVLNLIKKQG